ncbi:lipase [Pseudonocardiaceae bacterium YIM PH 21723]|nr:lipase [Pseudonocardiaceae bacterium YIM PH 21723]
MTGRLLMSGLSVAVLIATALVAPASGARTPAPGEILAATPTELRLAPLTPPVPGVTATRIRYRSTSATGAPNVVSGIVLVPTKPYPGPRPLIGYGVGSHGGADGCEPSAVLPQGTDFEAVSWAPLLAKGWALAITDYEGLGTPGEHTWGVGPAQGNAVLDILRAARTLPGLESSSLAVMGYSQGGVAAAWAAQLQPEYAPELRLAGVAVGAITDATAELLRANDGGPASFLNIAHLSGLDAAYPELRLDRYLTDKGRAALKSIRTDCVAVAGVKNAFQRLSSLTTVPILDQPDWAARFRANGAGHGARPTVPVLVYHSRLDEGSPFALGKRLRDNWCAQGADLTWKPLLTGEHGTTGAIGPAVIAAPWLADRLQGRPIASNCQEG